jgi:hypothetical protein
MPLIRITGLDGEPVWEGEGELEWSAGPLSRTSLRQIRTLPDQTRLARQLDLTEFLRAYPAQYSIRPVPPQIGVDFCTDPPTVTVPDLPGLMTELRFDRPAEDLSWLRNVLEEPVETPDERHVREEEAARLRRIAMMGGSFDTERLRTIDGYGHAPRAQLDWDRFAQDIARLSEAVRSAGGAMAALRPFLSGPDPAHDELIESVRSEFPYDPHGYGMPVYQGMRWEPRPDEKIRSHP